jgi:Fe-S oxidoreductase
MLVKNSFLIALILISFAFFSRRLAYILKLINLGRGSFQLNIPGKRFRDLLFIGFGQRIVLKELSGVGHAFIFWGFFFFSFGAVESLLKGISHDFSFAFLGPVYLFMNSGQDILGLLIILALLFSVYRRLILRPQRLKGSPAQTIEAFIIISCILFIIAASYGLCIIKPKPGLTPVADTIRGLILGEVIGMDLAKKIYPLIEWGHNCVILGFLVYILYSKHSHIVFALPNILLRLNKAPGLIAKLDLEDETAERYGVQTITDLRKKDLLELFACTECGRCQESCPAYSTGKTLNPKKIMVDLRNHLLAEGPSLTRLNPEKSKPLYPAIIDHDMLWACSTCRACDEVCPVENAPMEKIIGIRQERVLMEGDFPEEAQTALRNIETQYNPWGLPQEQRMNWAKGSNIQTLAENPDVEYLLFVGCAGSYDQRYISVTRALVKILQKAGIEFGILGNEERCTGDSAKRIGNDYLAQELANANVTTFNRYGVKKIIASCPHCFNTIKNEYPEYGGHYQVFHHSDFIWNLINKGKLDLNAQPSTGGGKITFHDSCYLGRYNQIVDVPRNIISYFKGNILIEPRRNRENGFCCGAGGGRMWLEDKTGIGINVDRTRELIKSDAETIVTSCPFCLNMISDGIKSENCHEHIQLFDIAEIVYAAL